MPIVLRGVAYGNLYLTEKTGGQDFTEEDEELTQLLAGQAAVAIENARLYELDALAAPARVAERDRKRARLELELDPLLALVARRLLELVDARLVLIALPDGASLRVAAAEGKGAYGVTGVELALDASKAGRVLERGHSERVDSVLDDPEVDQQVTRRLGVSSALYVPLVVRGRAIGVVIAHDKRGGANPAFTEDDLRLAETFAARAAIAVDLSEQVSRDAVRRVVEAQELERARLARELHDETGQALTSILLGLKPLEQAAASPEAAAAIESVRALVVATLQDVRRLAVELRPSALDDFGLVAAVERLADTFRERSGLAVDLEAQLGDARLPTAAETTLYRVIQEALTNIAKHADATHVSILVQRKGQAPLWPSSRTTGPASIPPGHGTTHSASSACVNASSWLGGKLQVESTPGAGTTLVAEVPIP